MQKNAKTISGFRTLLTEQEFNDIKSRFEGISDIQTNHYFDTEYFTLKAVSQSLRVRERGKNTYELVYRHKVKYELTDDKQTLSNDEFNSLVSNGTLPDGDIKNDLVKLTKSSPLVNFMNLSTERFQFKYKLYTLLLDKDSYCGKTDYTLEAHFDKIVVTVSDVLDLLKDLHVEYKKASKKIDRAWAALRETLE